MCDESISDYESRAIGGTENSWCRGVSGGTGITVLSLVLHKQPNVKLVENALQHLHIYHPILGAKLHLDPATATFSLLIPSCSSMKVEAVDYESTAKIIQSQEQVHRHSVTPFEILVEYELNNNPWENLVDVDVDVDVMHVSVYEMIDGKWVVMMKLHTGICDRTAAVAVMKELMGLMMDKDQGKEEKGEVMMSVEEYIPSGKMNKPFWSRGVDMLGYSLNSFRLNNLDFSDPNSPRSSRLVRFFMDSNHTSKLLQGCKDRGIKLCGPLSAAALIAARSSKCVPDGEWEKYAVVTLIDCRKLLQPTLSTNHVGFYHSAILNTHDMKGGEELWELAGRTYASFEDAKNSNKHFTDMADLNFLMCRAIENPGLTPSSSLRTSFISVFEDPVIDETNENYEELGVEDYMGCASTHGVGPSIAVFDTVRQGKLDCTCVYPFPLHSREQMQELIDNMKKILIDYL